MLYRYELKKLFSHKLILTVLLICIVANAVITVLTTKYTGDEYTSGEYKSMWYILSDLSGTDAESFLEMRQRQLEYSSENWQELCLVKDIKAEVESADSYNEYVDEVIDDAGKRLTVSGLFQENEFLNKNLKKTIEDYRNVSKKELTAQPQKGVLLILQSKVSDYLMLALILLITAFLIIPEKESREAVLFATTVNGQENTIKAKFMVLFIMICCLYLIFYIENILTAQIVYGIGDTSRYIQSITEYKGCLYGITVAQFMAVIFSLKLMVFVIIAMLMIAVCYRMESGAKIVTFIGIFGAAEFIMHRYIPESSLLSPFKYINIISFLKIDKLLGKYVNINFAGYPVNSSYVVIISMVTICVELYVFFIKQWKVSCIAWNKKVHIKHIFDGIYRRNMYFYEMLRIGRKSRILVVFTAVAVLQIFRIQMYSYENEPDKVYFRTYMQYISGLSYTDQQKYVENENQRYGRILNENVTEENRVEHGNNLLPYNAWQKVVGEYDRISMLRESGADVQLTYSDGYEQLMGADSKLYVASYVVLVILLILAFSGIYAIDYEENMNDLISVTYYGRRKIMYERTKYSVVTGILCFVMTYLPEFIMVQTKIGLSGYQTAAGSLSFHIMAGNLKIWQCMLILYILRLVGMTILIVFISYLSNKFRNTFAVMGIAALVLIMPVIFGFMRWMPVINANLII